MKRFFVYMLATRSDGPLYVGVTSNLPKRIAEHRSHAVPGFTVRYNIDRLVWFEPHDDAEGRSCARSVSSAGAGSGRWR